MRRDDGFKLSQFARRVSRTFKCFAIKSWLFSLKSPHLLYLCQFVSLQHIFQFSDFLAKTPEKHFQSLSTKFAHWSKPTLISVRTYEDSLRKLRFCKWWAEQVKCPKSWHEDIMNSVEGMMKWRRPASAVSITLGWPHHFSPLIIIDACLISTIKNVILIKTCY